MKQRIPQVLSLVIAAGVILLVLQEPQAGDDRVRPIPTEADLDEPVVSSTLLMRTKLTTSQRVLEGLLDRDFEAIRASAQTLTQISEIKTVSDDVPQDDRVYEHFRIEFQRLSQELEAMAIEKNLTGAAYVHQNLTATCIACHDYVREEN